MANRILRDWTDSEIIDTLSFQAEVLFIRLFMKADDYGCFHANPKLVKAAIFPLKDIREADITRWIAECKESGLIALYENSGKKYLVINNFGQRLRIMKRKYPDPNEKKEPDRNPPSFDRNLPLETKRNETEVETETEVEIEEKIKSILESSIWIEQTAMHFKMTVFEINECLKTFLSELKLKDDLIKPEADIKKHFINALKKNIENAKKYPHNFNERKAGLDGLSELTNRVLQQPFTLNDNYTGDSKQ